MDLGYLNARTHAWKSRLIAGDAYKRLLGWNEGEDKSVDSYRDALLNTDYGRLMEIGAARIKRTEDLIGYAIKRSFDERLALLWRQTPDEARPLLNALLAPWEAAAIKVVIRGVEMNAPRGELVEFAAPAGEFTRGAMEQLCLAKNIEEVLGILRAWRSPYSIPVRAKLKDYMQKRNLYEIEAAIDKFSFMRSRALAAGDSDDADTIKRALEDRIDSVNTATLFKLVGGSFTKDSAIEFFIDGGKRLSAGAFAGLLEIKDKEKLVSSLAERIADKAWQKALYSVNLAGAQILEEDLEFITGRRLVKKAMIKPLGIAPAAAYVFRLVREAKNLRLILRGKAYAMPQRILDELIKVYDINPGAATS